MADIIAYAKFRKSLLICKESEAVSRCLQYEQCAGPQKLGVINDRSSIIFWEKNKVRGVF
jgi:hypothetical protein